MLKNKLPEWPHDFDSRYDARACHGLTVFGDIGEMACLPSLRTNHPTGLMMPAPPVDGGAGMHGRRNLFLVDRRNTWD